MPHWTSALPVSQSPIRRYGLAILSVAIALALAFSLSAFSLREASFLTAIAVTVWYGRMGPGLLAIVLSILCLDYFFIPPLHHIEPDLSHLPYFVVFTSFALLISWFSASRRRAEEGLRQARNELEAKVVERTAELHRTTGEAVAAQQRFRDLVNSVEGIVWEADASTFQFLFVSSQAERILGYPTQQWLTEPSFWKDHLHPDDRTWAVDFCINATAEKRNHEFEYRMLAVDGRVVWIRDLVTVVVEHDRATRLRGVMLDVTTRKQAEAALREQAHLLDLTHDAIFVRDMHSVITFWNRGAEELYGWKAQQAIGNTAHQLLQTVFPAPLEQIEAETLSTGRWEGELIHTKADGTQLVSASRWSLQRDQQGRPLAILETNNDISERKRAAQALRESEEQWKAVFENNPTMYFMVDANGTVASVNPYGAEQLGYRVDELVGSPVLNVFYPADRERVQKKVALCLENLGRTMSWEFRKVRKNGTLLWVRETARAMLIKNRKIVLIVCEDITERKRAEEALRQAQADLAHVNRVTTMGELTASLAHEVNQPIAAAVTNANTCLRWLTREHPDVEEARQAAARIAKDATRAAEIISRIRSLFKKAAPQRELVDLNELIREMMLLLQNEANRFSIAIRTELAPNLPKITADRVQLQQVFMNLMLNSIDAMKNMDSGGEITISSQQAKDGQLRVSVSDTGVGLPAEKTEHIFNAFFTSKPQGTGLGLTISRSIVESHGGRLWATPNSPRGATFHLTLPTKAEAHE